MERYEANYPSHWLRGGGAGGTWLWAVSCAGLDVSQLVMGSLSLSICSDHRDSGE